MNFLDQLLKKLTDIWKALTPQKRKRVYTLLVMLAVGLSLLLSFAGQQEYVVMFTGLEVYEAGEIYTMLKETNADVKMSGSNTILINKKHEETYRMTLASQGYPKTGLNYDIYMNNVGMGVSDAEKKSYMVFQLQDRLQNTIKTLNGINGAIVTISVPDESNFLLQSERKPVTASVVVDINKNAGGISAGNIKAIENLLCKSVSGLLPQQVSIIDTDMNLLNSASEDGISMTSDRYSLISNLEDNYEKRILSMLEPLFGFGNVKVGASVKMNFDKIEEENTIFTPVIDENGIITAISEIREQITEGEAGNESSRTERETSYLINQKKEVMEYEQGKIESLKVSVLINDPELDQEVLDNVVKLAAYTAGIEEQHITAQAMEFAQAPDFSDISRGDPAAAGIFSDTSFVLYLAVIVFVFILLLMIIQTLKSGKKALKKMEPEPEFKVEELKVKADAETLYRNEIEKYLEKNPEGVADIMKKWMVED